MVTSNSTARPNSLRATARVLSSPSSRVVPRSTPTVPASVCGQCSVPRLERRGGSMRRPARVVVPVAVLALTAYLSADVADVVPGAYPGRAGPARAVRPGAAAGDGCSAGAAASTAEGARAGPLGVGLGGR